MDSTLSYSGNKVSAIATSLKLTYAIVPIVAGLDKFFHLLTNWDKYLAPIVVDILPFEPHIFMLIVGVIEIIAGVIVLLRPRIGALIVALWLLGIALNLLLTGEYYDIAVRDIVMAIGAYSLYQLADK